MQHKQFPPTPKRLRDARRKGDVAHSADLSSSVTFIAVVVLLWALAGTVLDLLRGLWLQASSARAFAQPEAATMAVLQHALTVVVAVAMAIALMAGLFAAAGSFVQVGGLAAWSRLQPNAAHLNPGQGLERLFSMRNVINLAKLVLKTLLLGVLLLVVVRSQLDTAARVGYLTPAGQMATVAHTLLVLMGWAAVIYAAMSALDVLHQRFEFTKRNRMSWEDLRREHQETEGSVLNQQRRRAEHHEAVFSSVDDRIGRATLVVHSRAVAVALRYLSEDDLPRVVALGQGAAAEQIVRAARERGLALQQDAALAARLLADGALDQKAPQALQAQLTRVLLRALGRESDMTSKE